MDEKKIAYKRVLLKLSGEALSGDAGDGAGLQASSAEVCGVVAQCAKQGVEVGIVVGGGNFWRGVKNGEGTHGPLESGLYGHARHGHELPGAWQDVHGAAGRGRRKVLTAMEMPAHRRSRSPWRRRTNISAPARSSCSAAASAARIFSTDTGAVLRAARDRRGRDTACQEHGRRLQRRPEAWTPTPCKLRRYHI